MLVFRKIATAGVAVSAALAMVTGTGAAAPATEVDDRVVVNCEPGKHPTQKFTKQVWVNQAPTYRLPAGKHVGKMNKGGNYFYCQRNWGERFRVTVGNYTNTWWALTDDDSGNRDVWLSVVYIVGGDNNKHEPGIPTHRPR